MSNGIVDMLIAGSKEYSVLLTDSQIGELIKYKDILKEWNQKINLTAIEDDKEIIIKHFIDSLSIIPYLENKEIKLIDVGTGGGFPGIPIKIAFDKINVTLLDSLDKRIKFLNNVISELKLQDIRACHGRAEDFGMMEENREKYDVATARAVANLPVLLEYCLPFVKVGGIFIAMKGNSTEEVDASNKALDVLGGKIEKIENINLPFTDAVRNIVIVKKIKSTPKKYPRKAGKPTKEPIL
ncbi:16S rRNA (guanine(527)-N(7))-methyltransferase RsmG [Pseudobacteroides cellulosolvens]|uniref:Ribosomal RNA small subunit methyltransferase G n=1 Tax=Pseudobacteroides cellulosolvens ATCC 35603 = DSM 2933 TaxID=398512 RepID=A0A0L6JWE1_9FIRM|nr:16S rRNA (guanine(527)-N(7))-methyltransferase RsmG [Pseudobacteroides cellulosolvens]KNY29732.1 Ribosomal RNA small subunit methyltransferase G [Pseudobacteroides cellulosolvens ATCC 35603 = DSM 2933]